MKLMLIEDDYLLNKAIKTYLESKQISVDGFTDGEKAIQMISDEYDLYIIDIDIPNITGIEILQHIRKTYLDIPVIIISATIDMSMITKAYSSGCNDYLKKPFDIKELELKINAFTKHTQNSFKLAEQLYYDKHTKSLVFQEEEILLSKNEKLFIYTLALNKDNYVSSETLEQLIWEDNTPHLRQLVSRLRKKLPLDIIKNQLNKGYKIS